MCHLILFQSNHLSGCELVDQQYAVIKNLKEQQQALIYFLGGLTIISSCHSCRNRVAFLADLAQVFNAALAALFLLA